MKHRIFSKSAFTLIELVFVAMIIGLIMPAIFSLYNFIIRSNREINARQDTIQQGYEFFERLNILMQDYTIDYEEYFNRQMAGCVGTTQRGSGFKWNIGLSGYCTEFTAYGNENSTNRNGILTGYHDVYYCSSDSNAKNPTGLPVVVKLDDCGKKGFRQSYRQYETFFIDVGKDTEDKDSNRVGDGDDYNKGFALNNVNAIQDSDHIQELYFISHDGKSRLFFRRKLYNQNGTYMQYKIEMIRLRGFDAGIKHNFSEVSSGNVGLYDGKIDTRACDTGMGFVGHGDSIDSNAGAYKDYHLPKDVDDCWIPITYGSTSVSARNMGISPTTDSDLSWNDEARQINAYMKILTVNGVYLPYYTTGTISNSISDFKVPLETIINMKDFYRD